MKNPRLQYFNYIADHLIGPGCPTEIEMGMYLDDLMEKPHFKKFDSEFKVPIKMRDGDHNFRPSALITRIKKEVSRMDIFSHIFNPRFMYEVYKIKNIIDDGYEKFVSENNEVANVQSV